MRGVRPLESDRLFRHLLRVASEEPHRSLAAGAEWTGRKAKHYIPRECVTAGRPEPAARSSRSQDTRRLRVANQARCRAAAASRSCYLRRSAQLSSPKLAAGRGSALRMASPDSTNATLIAALLAPNLCRFIGAMLFHHTQRV